jgi:hypothetical protein
MEMAENGEIKTLIGTLQQLYSRLVQFLIGTRRRAGSSNSGAAGAQGIESLLSEHLEKLAVASEKKGDSPAGDVSHETVGDGPGVGGRHPRRSREGADAAPEFTQHFHDLGAGELVGASVGEKIKSRALEHMNKALLLARQGDRVNARLHADIANSAVKEAARFMTEGEYGEFVDLIKERLSKFKV